MHRARCLERFPRLGAFARGWPCACSSRCGGKCRQRCSRLPRWRRSAPLASRRPGQHLGLHRSRNTTGELPAHWHREVADKAHRCCPLPMVSRRTIAAAAAAVSPACAWPLVSKGFGRLWRRHGLGRPRASRRRTTPRRPVRRCCRRLPEPPPPDQPRRPDRRRQQLTPQLIQG